MRFGYMVFLSVINVNFSAGTCASDDTHICDSNATCAGSSCACKSGYSGNGLTCAGRSEFVVAGTNGLMQDINECNTTAKCDPLTTCVNTAGSYNCTACPSGYSGTGITSCIGTYRAYLCE